MPITTSFTQTLGLRIPLVQGGMQWVGVPELTAAVSNAGALGVLTALTQPDPQALRQAIRKTKSLLHPGVWERSPYGGFAVNLTLLPSITPPDYPAFVQAALDEGIRIFETAGNKPGEIIKMAKERGAFVIHKCTAVRHALSAEKAGADVLSIDGFECAGHPGEDDNGGLILLARAAESLHKPFLASGGIANGQGLVAALSLGAVGANMGTRFMCTIESPIHDQIKQTIVQADERSTTHIFRSLRNTSRVYNNSVAKEVRRLEAQGAQFDQIRPLVSGVRGREVYTKGDPEAGVWTIGLTAGLIHDVPTCQQLVDTIEADAQKQIARLHHMTSTSTGSAKL